jgi:hypothetical protein
MRRRGSTNSIGRVIRAVPPLLLAAGLTGCAATPAGVGAGPGIGHRSLVVPAPALFQLEAVADPDAPEHGRNDARLGRVHPRGGIVHDAAVIEDRQRIHVSGGRPRDTSTYRIRSWQHRD